MRTAEPDALHEADLQAWHVLSPLLVQGGYLPWSSGSMRPAALVAVCNEIVHAERTRIVECGSGVSTIVLARLLRQRGTGSLIALEHDRGWATLVEEGLRREKLDTIARVLHTPLQGEPPWYGGDGLREVPGEVDLLIVDGPPACAAGHGRRRAPALPWFDERLVPGAAVVLDDVDRVGERDVIAGWEAATDWRFVLDERVGVATGRRDSRSELTTLTASMPAARAAAVAN